LLGYSKEQFETILSQPYGLKRLLTRQLYTPAEEAADCKRHKALVLAVAVSDFLILDGGTYEDIYDTFRTLMLLNKQFREEEDAEILNQNKKLEFIHKIMAKELEKEREGIIKPGIFSEEEIRIAKELAARKEARETQVIYWLHKSKLMQEGLTAEQARERLYQDMSKGGGELAKFVKDF